MQPRLDNRTAGVTLVVGYGLVVVVLFAGLSGSLATATASVRNAFFFLVMPAFGFASGVYAALDGPASSAAVVVTASYLGLAGVTLALLLPGSPAVVTLGGVGSFGLAVVALVSTLVTAVESLGFGGPSG